MHHLSSATSPLTHTGGGCLELSWKWLTPALVAMFSPPSLALAPSEVLSLDAVSSCVGVSLLGVECAAELVAVMVS